MWWLPTLSYLLLFLLIFGISGTVDLNNFRSRLTDYRSLIVGIGCQFVILPLIGFIVVRALQLPPTYGLVLLVTVSSPGGSYSNWWCSICNADLALSVAMTTISTVASVGLLPLNLTVYVRAAYDESVRISWLNIGISIIVVISAIMCGLYAGLKFPSQRQRLNTMGNLCGVALIVLGLAFNSSSPVPLWSHEPIFYYAVALPCIFGALLSSLLSSALRIPRPNAVAITIEVCYQNTGIALTVALSTFTGDEAAIAAGVPLFYSAVQVIIIALFALTSWQLGWTYAPRTEHMAKCIAGNYQPGEDAVVGRVHPGAPADAPMGDESGIPAVPSMMSMERLSVESLPRGVQQQHRPFPPGESGGSQVFEGRDQATGSPVVIVQEWRQYTVCASPLGAPPITAPGQPEQVILPAPVDNQGISRAAPRAMPGGLDAGASDYPEAGAPRAAEDANFARRALERLRLPALSVRPMPPLGSVPLPAVGPRGPNGGQPGGTAEAGAPASALSTPRSTGGGKDKDGARSRAGSIYGSAMAGADNIMRRVRNASVQGASSWRGGRVAGNAPAAAPTAPTSPAAAPTAADEPPPTLRESSAGTLPPLASEQNAGDASGAQHVGVAAAPAQPVSIRAQPSAASATSATVSTHSGNTAFMPEI